MEAANGILTIRATATSTSLAASVEGFKDAVIASNPQLVVDVLADECTHNLTSEWGLVLQCVCALAA